MSPSTVMNIEYGLNLYVYPIFMIFGTVGNVFVVILFNQQRQNSCAIYLTSLAISNNLYLLFSGFTQIFPVDYSSETMSALVSCKIIRYITIVIGQIGKTMVVLACIDRFLITSNRAAFRAFSTLKRTKWIIFFSIMFWSLFTIHAPIMHTITYGQCGTTGIYSTIFAVHALLLVGGIPSIILGVFGYLTYCNMRQISRRVQPIVGNGNNSNHPIQRKDRDLLIIVIAEILVYVITMALLPLIILEMMISDYVIPNKSFEYLEMEVFIFNIALFLIIINSAIPFYVYLLSSKSFRRDFKLLIINTYQKLRNQPIIQPIPRLHRTMTLRDTRF